MVDKPKSGFQIPLNEWLRDELKPLVLKYLDDKNLDENIFDKNEIAHIKNSFFEGTIIWFVLMYQMWKEKWLD